MLSLIGSALLLIPGVLSTVEKLQRNWFDAKVRITAARIGGDVERAKAIVSLGTTEIHERNVWLSIIASSPLLTCLIILFASPFAIFIWKVVVVDIVIGPGCVFGACWNGLTDPIRGQVADWGNTIIVSIFGSGTAVTLSKMIMANRSDKEPSRGTEDR